MQENSQKLSRTWMAELWSWTQSLQLELFCLRPYAMLTIWTSYWPRFSKTRCMRALPWVQIWCGVSSVRMWARSGSAMWAKVSLMKFWAIPIRWC